jgi:CheY-like chemotaxis protein
MTANAIKGDRERCIEAGMNDYISKPVDSEVLVEKVTYWLEQSPQRTAAPKAAQAWAPMEPETSMKPAPAIDHTVLSNLSALQPDDSTFLVGLIDLYIKTGTDHLKALNDALSKNDMEKVTMAAHSMKSSSNNMGALRLGNLLEDIEGASRRGDRNAVIALVGLLQKEFSSACDELRAERTEAAA